MSAVIESPIFTVEQAAAYLQVGPRVVRRLIRQRKIAVVRIDGRGTYRIHRNVIDAYISRSMPVAEGAK
jgi:excisionase family DNA binding protein